MATRLETERLVVRTFEPRDECSWIAMFADPALTRFLDPTSQALPRTAKTFRAQSQLRWAMEDELGHAMWAVEERSTQELVGQCGLRPAARMDANAGSEIDLGYHFARPCWGRGYATEAVGAVLEHGLRVVRLERVMAVSRRENVGSLRVMEKAGMRYDGLVELYGLSDLVRYVAERTWWRRPSGRHRPPAARPER